MKKILYIFCLLFFSSSVYGTVVAVSPCETSIRSLDRFEKEYLDINPDCPKGKPLFKKGDLMCYKMPEKIVTDLTYKEELISFKTYSLMEEYPKFPFLPVCYLDKTKCPNMDAIQKGASEIKQENDLIVRKNGEISLKNKPVEKQNIEIQNYNNVIKNEERIFYEYERIWKRVVFTPVKGRKELIVSPKDYGHLINMEDGEAPIKPIFSSFLEQKWQKYLDKVGLIVDTNARLRKQNEKIKEENDNSKKKNDEIQKKNQAVYESNRLVLQKLKSYYTPDLLNKLLKDYELVLKKRCVSCDIPDIFFHLTKSECDVCPNREFIPEKDKDNLGTCQLKNKEIQKTFIK